MVAIVEPNHDEKDRRTSLEDVLDQPSTFRFTKRSAVSCQSLSLTYSDDASNMSRAYTTGGMEQNAGPNLHLASIEDLLAELERRRTNLGMATEKDLVVEIKRHTTDLATPPAKPKTRKFNVKTTPKPSRSPLRKAKSMRQVRADDRNAEPKAQWKTVFTPLFASDNGYSEVAPSLPTKKKLKPRTESPSRSASHDKQPASPPEKKKAPSKSTTKTHPSQPANSVSHRSPVGRPKLKGTTSPDGRAPSARNLGTKSNGSSIQNSPIKTPKKTIRRHPLESPQKLKKALSQKLIVGEDAAENQASRRTLKRAVSRKNVKSPSRCPLFPSNIAGLSTSGSVETLKRGNLSPSRILARQSSPVRGLQEAKSSGSLASRLSPKKLEPVMLVGETLSMSRMLMKTVSRPSF